MKAWTHYIAIAALLTALVGCSSEARSDLEPKPDNHSNQTNIMTTTPTDMKQGVDKKMQIRRARYIRPSSQGSLILLTIEDKTSKEQKVIVVENELFMRLANPIPNYSASKHEQYVDYMAAHDQEPFVVESTAFAKLKIYAAPAPEAAMQALSIEELAAKYFNSKERSNDPYTIKDSKLEYSRAFLRLLLEKGCLIYVSCLDGHRMVKW